MRVMSMSLYIGLLMVFLLGLFVGTMAHAADWDSVLAAKDARELEGRAVTRKAKLVRSQACRWEKQMRLVPVHCFGPDVSTRETENLVRLCLSAVDRATALPAETEVFVPRACRERLEKRREDLRYAEMR